MEKGEYGAEERDAVLVYGGGRDVDAIVAALGASVVGGELDAPGLEDDVARGGIDAYAGGVGGRIDEDLVAS